LMLASSQDGGSRVAATYSDSVLHVRTRLWAMRFRAGFLLVSLAGSSILRAAAQTTPPPSYREVTDEIGRTIRVPQSIRRVVSLAPSLTETVYALGLQDLLVGDTDYCDYPPDAQQKPKVGSTTNPSLEAIAALHPDLVLVTKNLNHLETVEALEEIGIPSYATDPHTLEAIIASTEHLADLLGVPVSAASLASNLQHQLSDLQERIKDVSPTPILFVVWTQPLISIGKDTFIADALRHAGAVSIIDSSQNWPQVNLEEVVRLQPAFIIFVESHTGAAPQSGDTLVDLPGWRLVHAVRNHRYATISDAINRPAPRLVSAVQDLARQLHPEAFLKKPDAEKEQPIAPPHSWETSSLSPASVPLSWASTCAL
jgi:iron complex transport system substrate-binding protein